MVGYRVIARAGISVGILALGVHSLAQVPKVEAARAIVAGVRNSSADRHTIELQTTTQALANEIGRQGLYSIIAAQEVERVAAEHHLTLPLSEQELPALAREMDAKRLILGEIVDVHTEMRDRARVIVASLRVHSVDLATGDVVNGAAERGEASDGGDARRSEGLLLIDAATNAAKKAVETMLAYRPITGTVMSESTHEKIVVNCGGGNGIKLGMEFRVMRNGAESARLKVYRVYPEYAEMSLVNPGNGVRPQDRIVQVYSDPKFKK